MKIIKLLEKIKKNILGLDRISYLMIGVILLSFLVRIAYLFYNPVRGWDESVYLNLGSDLAHNPLLYSLINSGWNDFIPSTDFIYSWPNIGFRPPVLPYTLAILSYFKLNFIISILIPIISTWSVYLVFVLGKNLFNKRVGLISAIFFALLPINIYTSQKIWVDSVVAFFILLSFNSFWQGFEVGNKRQKLLFGLYLALALLTRYTAMWIAPVFLLYFLFRDKSLNFLKDKYLWLAVLIFFLVIIPWLIYGYVFYGQPLGGFIHGLQAANYYGGIQEWSYYLSRSWRIFTILGLGFIIALFYLIINKEYQRRQVYLLLIWGIFFSVMVMAMPHKEDRYILLVGPVVCIIVAYIIDKVKNRFYLQYTIIILFIVALSYTSYQAFKIEYVIEKDKSSICLTQGFNYINTKLPGSASIISQQSPVIYYYTKRNILPYPEIWSISNLENIINYNRASQSVYIFYTSYDSVLGPYVHGDLEQNYAKVFECSIDYGFATVYNYK